MANKIAQQARPALKPKAPTTSSVAAKSAARSARPAAKLAARPAKSIGKSAARTPVPARSGTIKTKAAAKPSKAAAAKSAKTPPAKAAVAKTVVAKAAPAKSVVVNKPVAVSVKAVKPVAKAPARPTPVAAKPAPVTAAVPTTAKIAAVPAPTAGLAAGRPTPPFKPAIAPLVAKPVIAKPADKPLKPRPEPIPVKLPPAPVRSDGKMARNQAGISTKELEHFRDLLFAKRRELLGDMSSMETSALRSGNSNLSTLPMHMADTGTDNYEQEFTLGLVQKDRELLKDINKALAKIQDGSYGICEGTGKPISKPRLEAQPWAKYSIEHARSLERPQFRRAFG